MACPWPNPGTMISSKRRPAVLRRLVDGDDVDDDVDGVDDDGGDDDYDDDNNDEDDNDIDSVFSTLQTLLTQWCRSQTPPLWKFLWQFCYPYII